MKKEITITKHYVTFCSPGTMCAEESVKEIDEYNVEEAVQMSRDIKERHGALPYGFYFSTRGRAEEDLDSHEITRTGVYYLGGEVMTLERIRVRNRKDERILRSNMETNGWDEVVINRNSYKWTQPLHEKDTVLDMTHYPEMQTT